MVLTIGATSAAEGSGAYSNGAYVSCTSIPGEYRATKTPGGTCAANEKQSSVSSPIATTAQQQTAPVAKRQRDNWSNDVEFLLSCIALSVGLGNVWRFPFTALENGGGAFLIPYLIVLLLVGKPVYYMEMLLGQFSSRGSVKVFDFCPALRGVGYGQVFATAIVTTYYATLMALTLRYFVDSFWPTLPWSHCRAEWGALCIDSALQAKNGTTIAAMTDITTTHATSAEFYFTNIVLRERDSIDDGIGWPSWSLALALAFAWCVIASICIRGVRSSGKAAYFLALFPYAILLVLLARALTLPGAFDGVLYFLRPQWDKLMDPKVWYAAVTQVFFSLAICFGNIIMYASYNRFGHNVHRDAVVVTTLDTFTSLLSGIVIFGILGHLAHNLGTDDIQSVVKGGTGLAFISYPDAIAKFQAVPQIFSVLFFFMLFVLGVGSNVGMVSCILTVLKDQFVIVKRWMLVLGITVVGYFIGLVYITPGGQYMLNLLDFYGASFVALVLAIFELFAIGWVYGVKRFCRDAEFMLGIRTSIYYRLCWAIITPALMLAILVYTLVSYEPLQYKGHAYNAGLYIFGWCLTAFGIGQLLFWGMHAVWKQSGETLRDRINQAFMPKINWGPMEPKMLLKYKQYVNDDLVVEVMFRKNSFWRRFYDNIFG